MAIGTPRTEEIAMNLVSVTIQKPEGVNLILGQAHFIKTVEDLHEALVTAVPGIAFGLAFCESSGPCLVRGSGTDPELAALARTNAEAIGAGHSFLVLLRDCYPINVLPVIRQVPEVCGIYCATANPVEVVIAETATDGHPRRRRRERPRGVEGESDVAARKAFLRQVGYKL
jgi:adenosine/AMP kinase